MEIEEEPYSMIDLLAFNCTDLKEQLENTTEGNDEKILFDYLTKADRLFKGIDDFKEDSDWFNVTEPLSFNDSLRGKITVLDFFTYCCINCMHIMPDLKRIEQLYSVTDGFIVIGVHSAKFDNEKDSSNILSAIQRYNITHPVINDTNSHMWNSLNIQCWPTLLILGPRGNPLFVIMGEGHYDILAKYVTASMNFYKDKLKNHSLPLNPATDLIISANLKFPGKIACSKLGNNENSAELYAVSDSGNHRILILNSNGEVMQKIGGKDCGFKDGNFNDTRFNNPQGLGFLNNDILFVADTDNHAVRKIDLKLKIVETVLGTGKQGIDRIGGNSGKEQEISSPWDIAIYRTRDLDMSFHMEESTIPEKDVVLIAMAGTHQIWALFLGDVIWWKFKKYSAGACVAIAGNGIEENRNNSYPNNASFAQPSGLSISKDTKEIFIADSESSSIRKMSLSDGKVSAVAGGDKNPRNLFAFGDEDGKLFSAKLQHPLGVSFNKNDNCLYIADTYNHKIKKVDITTMNTVTCKILDQSNNDYQLNEPGGLCLNPTGEILYIADTNNHQIEIIDLHTMKKKTMNIQFNTIPLKKELGKLINFSQLKMKTIGGKIRLTITVDVDNDIHFTDDAPQKWNVYLPNERWYINQQNGLFKINTNIELDITAAIKELNETENIIINFKLNLCQNNLCFPKLFSIQIPIIYDDDQGLDCIIEDICIKIYENDIIVKS